MYLIEVQEVFKIKKINVTLMMIYGLQKESVYEIQ